MIKQYPYLNDTDSVRKELFFIDMDRIINKKGRIKITLLDWEEEPIRDIEGEISSGSISFSGDSAVQRSGSISCSVNAFDYDAASIKADYSINKKVFVEIGVVNDTDYWKDYPILWFPQGVFLISSFNLSIEPGSPMTLSIGLQDKMALLDGTVGGTYPVTVTFDSMDEQADNGKVYSKKTPIYSIIQELVNHYGNIPLEKIIIEDIGVDSARGNKSRLLYQWNDSSTKLILYQLEGDSWNVTIEDDLETAGLILDEKTKTVTYKKDDGTTISGQCYIFSEGDYIGYEYTNLTYTSELTGSSGDTAANTLATIANYLGNYQFFFDVYGNFRFREIRNYKYVDPPIVTDMTEDNYLGSYLSTGSVHKFTDSVNIYSYEEAPQYNNIKNDYYVIGEKNSDSTNMQIMYHVAFDDKPEINENGYKNLLIYKEPSGTMITCGFPELVRATAETGGSYSYQNTDTQSEQITSDASNNDTYNAVEYTYSFSTAKYKNEQVTVSDKSATDVLPIYGLQNRIYGVLDYPTKYKFNNTIEDLSQLISKWGDAAKKITSESNDIFNLKINGVDSIYSIGHQLFDKLVSRFADLASVDDTSNTPCLIASEIIKKYDDDFISTNASDEYSLIQKYAKNYTYDIRSTRTTYSTDTDVENELSNLTALLDDLSLLSEVYQYMYTGFTNNGLTVYAEEIQTYINNFINARIDYYTNLKQYAEGFLTISNVTGYSTYFTQSATYTTLEPHFYYWNNEWVELDWYRYFNYDTSDSENILVPYDYIDFTQPLLDSYNGKTPRMALDGENCNYDIYVTYAKANDLSYCEKWETDKEYYHQYISNDWRTELLLRGLYNEKIGVDTGWYYSELKAWWPFTYDILNNCFPWEYEKQKSDSAYDPDDLSRNTTTEVEGYYFLDFIESNSPTLGQYNIDNIGRRTLVVNDTEVNCLFSPVSPDFVYYNTSNIASYYLNDDKVAEKIAEIREAAGSTPVIQMPDRYWEKITTAITKNGAYDIMLNYIHNYTVYQNTISISTPPTYYLMPSERVTVENKSTNTYGDYMVNGISYTFGQYSQCSITLSPAADKI